MTFPSLERLWKSVKRMIGEQFKDVVWADRVILELENNNRGGSAQIRSWFEDEDSRSPKVMHDLRYEMEDKDYLPTHWKTRYAELTHRVGGAINPIFGSILRQHLKEKSNPSR
ncbi:hypothetical protein KAF26_15250 [Xanthomonas translucens pv. secalis]|uniref:hypothetical protein n=1 Tax=Xanthomonas campestris pv. translucens TaxID=343 RepID=UPI001F2A1EC1|nr:hypothetical protein [Xanthomonas translucens]UKE42778.1 hypothetical protein KAF26_15250 [Xanthomonas translucens pv. secalis]